jgi:hypothetical protein
MITERHVLVCAFSQTTPQCLPGIGPEIPYTLAHYIGGTVTIGKRNIHYGIIE